jgi:hypothetical protein
LQNSTANTCGCEWEYEPGITKSDAGNPCSTQLHAGISRSHGRPLSGADSRMALILWNTDNVEPYAHLESALSQSIKADELKICRDIDHLVKTLRQPVHQDLLVVLCADSREDLCAIAQVQPMLNDVKVIVILPDRSRETIALGHRLKPRYLTFADENIDHICVVIDAIRKRIHKGGISSCRF